MPATNRPRAVPAFFQLTLGPSCEPIFQSARGCASPPQALRGALAMDHHCSNASLERPVSLLLISSRRGCRNPPEPLQISFIRAIQFHGRREFLRRRRIILIAPFLAAKYRQNGKPCLQIDISGGRNLGRFYLDRQTLRFFSGNSSGLRVLFATRNGADFSLEDNAISSLIFYNSRIGILRYPVQIVPKSLNRF